VYYEYNPHQTTHQKDLELKQEAKNAPKYSPPSYLYMNAFEATVADLDLSSTEE